MKTIIETTKNKAIKVAKEQIRTESGAKHLNKQLIKNSFCQCCCGQAYAVEVIAFVKNQMFSANVGVCEVCGNN